MNTPNTMPGFTAEASLHKVSRRYRATADTSSALAAGLLMLALDNRSFNTQASVDCKTFPDNVTCHECNSTGPGTFDCCELGGMRHPGDSCIIVNDPNPLTTPPPSRFQRFHTNRTAIRT